MEANQREIKFRAWDEVFKKFVDVSHCASFTDRNDKCKLNIREKIKFMQYTGLKDKNDVEIYEGDIVVLRFERSDKIYSLGVIEYGKVDIGSNGYEYSNHIFGFYPKTKDDNNLEYIYDNFVNNNVEVIGNIYENPELLEKQ